MAWMFLFVLLSIIVLTIVASSLFGWVREIRPTVKRTQLRTGDILTSTPKNVTRYSFNIAGLQPGHIMMVVVDDKTGEQNFMEITGYYDWMEGKTMAGIHPLSDRLDDEEREEFVTVFRTKTKIPSDKVYEFIELMKGCKFNYNFIKEHLKQRFMGLKRDMTANRLCCSELVYLCLVHCGILKYNENDFCDSFRFLSSGIATHSVAHDLMN